MIENLESVVTFIDEVISNFTNSLSRRNRAAYGSCTWLDENLDRLIAIGNDTSKKSEIYQIDNNITEAHIDISSCNQTHIDALKNDRVQLYQIICHLKERIGLSCPTTYFSTTLIATTITSMVSTPMKTTSTASTLDKAFTSITTSQLQTTTSIGTPPLQTIEISTASIQTTTLKVNTQIKSTTSLPTTEIQGKKET